MHPWLHFKTITRHKLLVMHYCFRAGMYKQGLLHDLSKYAPVEFLVGCKYYQGDRSPNNAEREDTGISKSWLHHKGRNKHHFEYWVDYAPGDEHIINGVPMPRKYIAEMVMDRISASRNYLGDKYDQHQPLDYYLKGKEKLWFIHPKTKRDLEGLLRILNDHGEEVLTVMNLPNKLSMFRIVLVPVIACIYLFTDLPEAFGADVSGEHIAVSMTALLVLILFAIASFTDYLDGHIARKHNLITSFGKFIDPIADKLLVNTMFILFAVDGVVPAVFVLIMIWRDMIVDGLRMNASAKGKVVAAGMMGKAKTVLQMFAIIFLLLNNLPFAFVSLPVADILFYAAVAVSVASGAEYFLKLKDIVMETM